MSQNSDTPFLANLTWASDWVFTGISSYQQYAEGALSMKGGTLEIPYDLPMREVRGELQRLAVLVNEIARATMRAGSDLERRRKLVMDLRFFAENCREWVERLDRLIEQTGMK